MADKVASLRDQSAPTDEPARREDEAVAPAVERGSGSLFQQLLMIPWIGVLLAIIALSVFLTIKTGSIFFSVDNFSSVALDFSFIAIAALGSAIVIIGGGIDLSVGSNMALTGVLTSLALQAHWPIPLAITAGLCVGLVIGVLNAFLVTGVRLIPFIATLGMLSALRGLGTGIVSGQTTGTPDAFNVVGQGYWGPIPISAVLLVVLAVLSAFFMNNTRWGRHIYAVGGNETAARLLGVKVNRVKAMMYILAGLLGAVGGVVLTARLGSSAPNNALGYELICIASAVIGGASLTGGEGSIFGVLVGAILLALIRDGLDLLGWGDYWQDMVIGLTILLAVSVDQLRRRLRRA